MEYLHDPQKFKLLPNVLEGLKKLQDMGYRLVIVTNQGGIGLGYYTEEDFYRVNREMFRQLAPAGIKIDKIYFCPHSITEKCTCRKPNTGLIERAVADLNIDLPNSFFIGDKTIDLETGRRAGIRKILVRTGHAGTDATYSVTPDYVADDLLDAAQWMLRQERS
ncbi:MAG: HAD family hydrolase [Calditrichaeota bacterium]|nr:HAD family hydrolase [Calditrichota bacterium]